MLLCFPVNSGKMIFNSFEKGMLHFQFQLRFNSTNQILKEVST